MNGIEKLWSHVPDQTKSGKLWRRVEGYPEHLQPIIQTLLEHEEHLSDGFGWYLPHEETEWDSMERIAQALYDAMRGLGELVN